MKTNAKTTKKISKNERYLQTIYQMMKKRDGLAVATKNTYFNDTELRLFAEIVSANSEGERLISTQLAARLGVTRSAISQMVNRLEKEGVVRRVADEVDRKIAYIELTDKTLKIYQKDWEASQQFFGKVVKKFGEDRFFEMCSLSCEFIDLLEEERQAVDKANK